MGKVDVTLRVIGSTGQGAEKRSYVEALGAVGVVALGNGRNDRKMLRVAPRDRGRTGRRSRREALDSADVVVASAVDALELLLHPLRLVATLRD